MSTPKLAHFLRQDCQLNLSQINDISTQARLRNGIVHWFAETCPLPPSDYLDHFALLSDLFFNSQTVQFNGQLDEVAKWQFFLSILPDINMQVPGVKKQDWLFPVQTALGLLQNKPQLHIGDVINVGEALLHVHFVTLASQFYWALREADLTAPSDAVSAGVSTLFEALQDAQCGGGAAWLERAAVLTVAAHSVRERLPFAELVDILQPAQLAVKSQANKNAKTQKINPTCWILSGNTQNPVYLLLKTLTQVRNRFHGHSEQLNTDSLKALSGGLLKLLNMLLHVFLPYRGLQVAMLSEADKCVGVHCFWASQQFLCATNPVNFEEMQAIWTQLNEQHQVLSAPPPPREAVNWQWDGTLLLYDEQQPYQRYLYLMPLGFLYQPQSPVAQQSTERTLLPGWLDSVRWQQKRVASVSQRTYQGVLPLNPEGALQAAPLGAIPSVHQCIENIVQSLCEHFPFPFPQGDDAPLPPARVFDLAHERLAQQWAAHSIERRGEIERLRHLLLASSAQRLLLLGASGSGKTVLLAQWFLAHQDQAVFVSLDDGQLSASGDTEELTKQRVGMHCLAALRRLVGLSPPTTLFSAEEIQQAIRDCLTPPPEQPFFIVLDAVNQAVDPGGLLEGLPQPLPTQLFVLASSQEQRRAVDSLTHYGAQVWERTQMSQLALTEAQALVWQVWEKPIANQATPRRADLPADLFAVLCEQELPIYLSDWTERLRAEWQAHPDTFAATALALFTRERDTALPEFSRLRWERARAAFRPPQVLEQVLWCLAIVGKALSVAQLQQGIAALARLDVFQTMPAAVPPQTLDDALYALSGFLSHTRSGFNQEQWLLRHEVLGHWFIQQQACADWLPKIRLSLLPLGAVPLPPNARDAEVAQWVAWVEELNYAHYESLSPEVQVSVVEGILGRLTSSHPKYGILLAHLGFVFLSRTGEHLRAFALVPQLQALFDAQPHEARTQAEIAITLGDIAQAQNQLADAQAWFEKDLELRESLLREANTPQHRRELSISYSRLGALAQAQNQLDQAQAWFEKGVEICEALLREANTPQHRRDLSISYSRLGGLAQAQNQLDQAQAWFEKCVEIFESLLREANTPQHRRELSYSYQRLGTLAQAQNQLDQAQVWFEKYLAISEALLREANTPQHRRDLSVSYVRLGDLAQAQNQLDQAQAWLEKGVEIFESLLREANTPQHRQDLSYSYNRLGDLAQAQNQLDQAQAWFEKDLAICEALLREANTPQNRRDLSYSYQRLGDVAQAQNQLDQAQAWLEKCVEIFESLLREANTPQHRQDLSYSYNRLGDLAQAQNQLADAQAWFEKDVEICEALLREANTPQHRRDLSNSYSRLGDLAQAQNQLDQAQVWFEKYLAISEALLREANTPQNRRELSVSYMRLGDLAQAQNQLDQAQVWFEKYLAISEALLREANTPQNQLDLAVAHNRLGNLAKEQNKLAEALSYHEQSFALIAALYQSTPTPEIEKGYQIALQRVTEARQRVQK